MVMNKIRLRSYGYRGFLNKIKEIKRRLNSSLKKETGRIKKGDKKQRYKPKDKVVQRRLFT